MTEQHTPGPWVYRADCKNQTVRDANDLSVAFYVAKANGPIIAAAPDMLKALRDALDAWDTHNESGDMMQGRWVTDARAAIAKAEGRA